MKSCQPEEISLSNVDKVIFISYEGNNWLLYRNYYKKEMFQSGQHVWISHSNTPPPPKAILFQNSVLLTGEFGYFFFGHHK
jgi:hypothetical protein